MMRRYRNWPTAVLDRLHCWPRRTLTYRLRQGPELAALGDTFDSRIMNLVWVHEVYTSPAGFQIREGWVIADVGAHKGIFSVFAATRAGRVSVYAFEASPENFRQLSENVKRNGLANVQCFNVAVAGIDGESTLHLYPDSGQDTLLQRSDAAGPVREIRVPTWSLPHVLQTVSGHVDLLKIDIEGMEYDALLNCPPECLRGVDRIILEYHDRLVDTPRSAADLCDFLRLAGFSARLDPERDLLIAERAAAAARRAASAHS